jgi:hypothetical protein
MVVDLIRMKKYGNYKMQAAVDKSLAIIDENVAFAKYLTLYTLTQRFGVGWLEDASGLNGRSKSEVFRNFEGFGIVSGIQLELLDPVPDNHIASGRVINMLHKSTPRSSSSPTTRIFGRRYYDELAEAA